MTSELPEEYVAFVERHLEELRRDAARVVGDAQDADHLYPLVLSAVAVRWTWLELQRVYLRNPDAAEVYLDRAFARCSERWQPDHIFSDSDIHVWIEGQEYAPSTAPRYVSNAVRLAKVVVKPPRKDAAPLVEAAIAWYHAGEELRRRKYLAIVAVGVALLGVLAHFSAPPV
jgi:hypothetical protein